MPQIFRMGEYWIYFWTNENKPVEPIHVHIAKGKPSENATKVWITSAGKCLLCNNNSRIPSHAILTKGVDYDGEKMLRDIRRPGMSARAA